MLCPFDERYKTEMNNIFDEKNKYDKWMDVEIALAKAHWKMGHIKKEDYEAIRDAKKQVKPERIKEIESEIHHDLMAMVRALSEKAGKSGAYVHMGATSYDIEDTATAIIFKSALELIRANLIKLNEVLKSLALKYRSLVSVGRTHGQHAIPTTFGMKFALYYQDTCRNIKRIDEVLPRISVGAISGAVGSKAVYGEESDKLEQLVMGELGLKPAVITTQVIQRDRHAEVISLLSLIAGSLEKIGKEIRNLQRTEIAEVYEPFGKKQVGSSAMPQKMNPHKSERVCSLAKLIRSFVTVAMENIALEHERDLTNSANERIIFSHSFVGVDYMINQMIYILSGLTVREEKVHRNLELTGGAIMSERAMMFLVNKGVPRQEAHEKIRNLAQESYKSGRTFKDIIENSGLFSKAEVEQIFDYKSYTRMAEKIVERAVKGC